MGKIYTVVQTDESIESLQLSIEQSNGQVLKVPAREICLTVEGGSIEPLTEGGD